MGGVWAAGSPAPRGWDSAAGALGWPVAVRWRPYVVSISIVLPRRNAYSQLAGDSVPPVATGARRGLGAGDGVGHPRQHFLVELPGGNH